MKASASIAAHSDAPDLALGYLRDYAERWVGPSTFHLQTSHRGEAATIWNELGGFVGDDAKSIREHCRLLLDDDALAERMGRESRAMALRDYHEARWAADWKRLLTDFAGA